MPLNLWLHQILAILRLEMKKTFLAKRGLWIYIVAFSPVLLFGGHTIDVLRRHEMCNFGGDTNIFATVFQVFYLRLAIFFGCLGIFMNLFRGEMLDKSLHFYFLAPIRREVLLAGKFVAGLTAAVTIFCTSTLVQFFALYAHFDSNTMSEYMFRGGGLGHLVTYIGVTALACVGYGSFFLFAGVVMRNPIVPAVIILVWEAANGFLPALLQKFSVIYYLKSLCPINIGPQVPPPFSILAVNAEPISAFIAIPGLLVVSAIVLLFASRKVRRMEINYGTD
jgi:ABC-type transport system involved in multi-copper enzyme maturation permease subunit